jgi:hypothetical protein
VVDDEYDDQRGEDYTGGVTGHESNITCKAGFTYGESGEWGDG